MKQLNDITIRTDLRPGDLGQIIYLHGALYHKEYQHGVAFESIVAGGLHEFYSSYNAKNERIWIAEHEGKIIGCLLLKNRDKSAQLRYYLIHPEYRRIGLGNNLMNLFMEFTKECGYKHVYLWTTNELGKAAHIYKKFGFQLTEEKDTKDFGKSLTEQRYDMDLKEKQFLDIQNTDEIFNKLYSLDTNAHPLFGKMNAQQMVEHLTFVVNFSYGKDAQTICVSKEEEERSKNFVINTDKEFPEGLMFPGMDNNMLRLKQPDLKAAIEALRKALQEFDKYFSGNSKNKTVHPVLGQLNYHEWVKFHNKHFSHHFKQFKLL